MYFVGKHVSMAAVTKQTAKHMWWTWTSQLKTDKPVWLLSSKITANGRNGRNYRWIFDKFTLSLSFLCRIGTAGIAVQVVGSNWPKPHYTLLITGLCRFKVANVLKERPFVFAEVKTCKPDLQGLVLMLWSGVFFLSFAGVPIVQHLLEHRTGHSLWEQAKWVWHLQLCENIRAAVSQLLERIFQWPKGLRLDSQLRLSTFPRVLRQDVESEIALNRPGSALHGNSRPGLVVCEWLCERVSEGLLWSTVSAVKVHRSAL